MIIRDVALPSEKRMTVPFLLAALVHAVVMISLWLLSVPSSNRSREGLIMIDATQSAQSKEELLVLTASTMEFPLERILDSRSEPLSLRADPWMSNISSPRVGVEFAFANTDAKMNGGGAAAGGGAGQGTGGFFGIQPRGGHVVFVLDGSKSMSYYDRFAELRREVDSVLAKMPDTTLVNIIVFNKRNESRYFCRMYEPCTKDVYERAHQWLADMVPDGPTEPESALRRAFTLKPDEVLFLSDGEFSEIAVRGQLRHRAAHTRLHVINFHGEEVAFLKELASITGGEYRFVPQRLE